MSIRVRLALWYAGLLGVLLAGIGLAVYLAYSRAHYREVDKTLTAITEHYHGLLEQALAGGQALDQAVVTLQRTLGPDLVGANLVVYDAAGRVLYGTPLPGGVPREADFAADDDHAPERYRSIETDAGRMRVHTMVVRRNGTTAAYVQVADSIESLDRSIRRFQLLLVVAGVGGTLAATAGGIAIASRALRPIADVTETARAIALSRGFGRRLDAVPQNDELGELARTFNEMLASLDAAYRAQRQFVDDAAHELRAPLTSIIGNLEFLERARDLPAEERARAVGDARVEAERLGRLVGELLALARADAGQRVARQPVELDRVVVEAVRDLGRVAAGVDVGVAALEPALVDGDPDRLKQLLVILLDNALRYTPPGGRVRVALRRRGEEAVLSVADTGIGIAADDLPRVFDRFFRADPARSHAVEGSGLGLAIARWIAEAHDGRIEVESRLGQGSTFTVVLPLGGTRG